MLVKPEPKLGCVPLPIDTTSSPTFAKPHVGRSALLYFGIGKPNLSNGINSK